MCCLLRAEVFLTTAIGFPVRPAPCTRYTFVQNPRSVDFDQTDVSSLIDLPFGFKSLVATVYFFSGCVYFSIFQEGGPQLQHVKKRKVELCRQKPVGGGERPRTHSHVLLPMAAGSRLRLRGFKSQLCWFLALYPWTNYLTSLSTTFLI